MKTETFSWNLVSRSFEPGITLSKQLRRRIDHLSARLTHFPPDSVHLQVALTKPEGKSLFEVELNLKLPSTVLHAEREGEEAMPALKEAFDALERQVEKLKADLRGERRWKVARRKPRRERPEKAAAFGDPMLRGPQSRSDVLRNFILRHYYRLLLHTHRQVSGLEAETDIPHGSIDAEEVLDEVVRLCLEHPEQKPAELTYELWLYRLIAQEVDRENRQLAEDFRHRAEFPTHENESEEEDLDLRDAVALSFDPDEPLEEESLADPTVISPDLAAGGSDLVAEIRKKSRYWPRREREIFNLHFLEGFDPVEVAMIQKMERSEVETLIEKLRRRLRKNLSGEAA